MNQDRREFVVRMARGAAYVAPVITTLAAPGSLLGQSNNFTTDKGGMGMGMMMGMGGRGMWMAEVGDVNPAIAPGSRNPAGRPAPWNVGPPSSSGPTGPPSDGS